MRTADFDYALRAREHRPDARRAPGRGAAAGRPGTVARRWSTATSRDLPGLLEPGDLVVVNDTRVLPARLHLQRATGGHVEVLLLEPLDDQQRRWSALARPAKRLRPGERLLGPDGREVLEVVGRLDDGRGGAPARRGRPPAPSCSGWARCRSRPTSRSRWPIPSATRPSTPPGRGPSRRPPPGSTSPTASSAELTERGIEVARVELIVGLDTFQPVDRGRSRRPRDAQRALSRRPERARALCAHPRRGRPGGRRRHHQRPGPRERPRSGDLQGRTGCSSAGRSTGRWSTCCSPTSTCPAPRC